MKQFLFFLFLQMVFAANISAQNPVKCKEIVALTIEAINTKSDEKLNKHLSDDFTMADQRGEIARMVLSQVLAQIGDTVITYEEVSTTASDRGLKFIYSIHYKQMGLKQAVFDFNLDNKLKELSLFKMEVKTMRNSESGIQKNEKDVIEIPFEMVGKLISVDVFVNGKKRKFILDSGAPKVILNAKYFSKRDSTETVISNVHGVSGVISDMDIINLKSLDFAGIKMNNQKMITVNLAHLEEELQVPFYGLIGFELIKDYDLVFDYKTKLLTLVNPKYFENYKTEKLDGVSLEIVPFKLERHIPVIEAQIADKVYQFGIDSGAESNLIDETLLPKLRRVLRRIKTDDLFGADSIKKVVEKGKIKTMCIGKKSFKKLPTAFSNLSHLNEGYKLNLDGLIGYPILSKQKTIISFEREAIIFAE